MTPVLEVELETKRPRRRARTTAAAVFGAVLTVPVAASGAEAYVPDEGGSSSSPPSDSITSADAAERRAAPEPAPATPPKAAPEPIQKAAPEPAPAAVEPEPASAPEPQPADPKPTEHQALRDVEPEPAPEPEPGPAPTPDPEPQAADPKPTEHQALRDVEPEPAPDPEPVPDPSPTAPAAEDVKPNEHQALRDIEPARDPDPEPAPTPAPEDVKPNEHLGLNADTDPPPAPEDVKPNEHEGLRGLNADTEPTPAPEDVKPNEHMGLLGLDPQPADDGPRGDGDGPLPPYGGLDPQVWAHLPEEDRQAIREEQQRAEDELQLEEWEQNPPDYVALGDSYAAGTGTIPDGEEPAGQRTEDAYAPEIAEARNYDLEHVAYGGATTENVLEGQGEEGPQVDALSASTDVITISIGGNDTGFSDVASECGNPLNSDEDCFERVDEAQAFIEDELPGRLDEVYTEIETRAPEAEVIVVGYPRLWDEDAGDDGNALPDFSDEEREQLNATGDLLAVTIGEQAREYEFEYVDPRTTFEGHGVGSDDEYLNGLSADWGNLLSGDAPVDDDSFHPNEAGYDALGGLIVEELED